LGAKIYFLGKPTSQTLFFPILPQTAGNEMITNPGYNQAGIKIINVNGWLYRRFFVI
jgi:hypothetical protein